MEANDTARLGMPLLQPAQAQKHVTVNEALMRLDGMVNLVLQSIDLSVPPLASVDGQCWGVAGEAQGAWAGHEGGIAVAANGGWIFLPALAGMRSFILDRGVEAVHDGAGWVPGALTLGRQGSGLVAGMAEGEFTVGQGKRITAPVAIPAGVMVIGAVARVIEPLGGSLTGWQLGSGEAGAEDRFGKGLGIGRGSWARGLLGSPVTYYQTGKLIMTAENGAFEGGRVRLAVHWLELRLPGEGV
ncbi:DUF2793 domain-containing protein [Paracoccus onubensis]|uniref:DUF2793 domain-containing protein n=1 Tax=Paracoccus onubensis TaxID=1675788 RepID=A0A418SLP0_9RHOB|nr:DUF2793 domain-containing protein [Paracoccus onubensis]RJE81864.1 DUF2793 domain-containing protein [Paracoccus onubensis]